MVQNKLFQKFLAMVPKRQGRQKICSSSLPPLHAATVAVDGALPPLLLRHFGSSSPYDFTKQDVENYGVASEMVVSLFLADTSKQTKLVHTFVLTDFRIFNKSSLYIINCCCLSHLSV